MLRKAENIKNKELLIISETYKELVRHLSGKAREFIKIIAYEVEEANEIKE